ncbi:MAG: hypothetical protein JWO33_2588 [Caulobacteraceae bacterium]|nr:hypothetical protein [Caulobacteraceae bacterium]
MDMALTGLTAIVANADCEAGEVVARGLVAEGANLRRLSAGEPVGQGAEADIAILVLPPSPEGLLSDFPDDQALQDAWRHVGAAAELFQSVLPGMTARGSGRLIFVGPIEAKAITGRAADIDRAVGLALLGLVKAISGEVGPAGVTANSLLWDGGQTGEARARILDGLGASAAYFASPLSNFLTGLTIAVDEGRYGGVF